MKATKKQFSQSYIANHPAIRPDVRMAYQKLLDNDFVLVDGDPKKFWVNDGATLVMATPELDSIEKDAHIHEWIEQYLVQCMNSVASLKPDEFQVEPLEGFEGHRYIIRLWWD